VEYKRYLDNRYDLCKDCFYKLEEYTNTLNKKYGQARQMEPIREDEDILRQQHELTEYDRCTVKEAYRHRSLTKFKIQRLIWALTHVLNLLFFLYIHRHPQIAVKTNALWEDVLLYPFGIPSLKDVTHYLYDHLKWIIPSYYSDIKIILMCFEDKSRDYCDTLTITNGARELFVLHLMAYYGICWHPALYTWYNETRRFHFWKLYSALQHILFLFRTMLFMYPQVVIHAPLNPKLCAIIYTMVLFIQHATS
jgi:hypothetical protein